jgi:predicted PurR-regulated permease PerM
VGVVLGVVGVVLGVVVVVVVIVGGSWKDGEQERHLDVTR